MTRPPTFIPVLVLLAVAGWAAACDDGATEPPTPRATTVTVTPATTGLSAMDETVRLATEVRDQNGQAMAAAVTWLSGDPSVASVDATGLVTAAGNGTATITATAGSASGSTTVTVVENPDRAALVALYEATDGPNWVDNENWLTDAPLGDWYGVDADSTGRVVGLDLSGRWDDEARQPVPHGLSGLIAPELGSLSRLKDLDLHYNELGGPIPAELGKLANLQRLDLGYNELRGPMPAALEGLANLQSLTLRYNQLDGSIPPELGNLASLQDLDLAANRLSGPIPPEVGNLSRLSQLALWQNDLTGPIPAELGNLAKLWSLSLQNNTLTGPIPAELGNLTNLGWLALGRNHLTGPIPSSFLRLERLRYFYIGLNESLCVPGNPAFVAWLLGMERRDDEPVSCNAADIAVLTSLFEVAGGADWTESAGWVGDGAVEEWHGISADSLGRVTALDLTRNGLTGRLPDRLAEMARLTELKIADNPSLSGRLPLSLTELDLRTLHYSGTGLCAPAEASFRDWLGTIHSQEGTGTECALLPDREILTTLYEATDGPNWIDDENWLTDAPLGEWYGVDTDGFGRVVSLDLSGRWDNEARTSTRHGLRGAIPAQLSALVELRTLNLSRNALTGPIPPELGKLANLQRLDLGYNELRGPMPAALEGLANLQSLTLRYNQLDGSIPPELGNLASLQDLDLAANRLSGPIPPEVGSLSRLTVLDLWRNDLTGPIPAELGNLTNLGWLYLERNHLTGPIPSSFLRLERLRYFYIGANESLCVPGNPAFVAWLLGIEYRDEEAVSCNAADAAALKSLFEATGGSDWTNSTGWLGNGAVGEWHGVAADSLGRVTELDVAENGLAGKLPRTVGQLIHMTELRVGGNPGLSGRLPLSLARLSLQALHYSGTDLCAPAEPSFREWLGAIPSHEGTGVQCAPLSDREILEILYQSTGGPEWTDSENWLTDAPLEDWHGVSANQQGRVTRLDLTENNLNGSLPAELGGLASLTFLKIWDNADLTGAIPPELGDLSNLTSLQLFSNNLTGPIPPKLGNLSELTELWLGDNAFTGPIPRELGDLANLKDLVLQDNSLSGAIPSELGNLAQLTQLWAAEAGDLSGGIPPELGGLGSLVVLSLSRNNLDGQIPPALGELANLRRLFLSENDLDGQIPPALGQLANIELMWLQDNDLSGPVPRELGDLSTIKELSLNNNALSGSVPPEIGEMASLKVLGVTNNSAMEGPLPTALTSLNQLEALLAGDTDLCAPSDPTFQSWLQGVPKRRIASCASAPPPAAYLVQAVQSREWPVPLVAGKEALLRVFPTAGRDNGERLPPVRASFHLNGTLARVVEIPGGPGPIPTEVDEGSLATSANAVVPSDVVRPGLEMVLEIDPDGTLDPGLGVARRIPETGRVAVDVREMPLFDLTLIPFVWSETRDSSIVDLTRAMAADPYGHEMFGDMHLLPVGDMEVTAHEPVLTSSNNAFALRNETAAIRVMEGGGGHYMGMMSSPATGAAGVAYLPGRVSFSIPDASTIAHELGHNMYLFHAPCGGAGGPDSSYPYSDGSVGVWGYDFRRGGSLVRPSTPDLMSYCGPPDGVSDYHFTNALRYRLFDEGPPAPPTAAVRSLLLWGGVSADAVPYLEPAFVVEAPASLPDSTGEYQISGRTETGAQLFSLRFTIPETADGDGSSSFAFVLPVQTEWEGNLANISLTGPGGSFTLDGDSDMPMAILRNAQTGQIRGILRDSSPATQAAADAVGQGVGTRLDVLFSRGIPGAEVWWR